jgi:hypothetical protein
MKTLCARSIFSTVLIVLTLNSVSTSSWAQSSYSIARSSDSVVVQWSRTPGELEAIDSTTRVTVYGDGRVLVNFPEYSPRKGNYETRLSSDELDALMNDLVSNEAMEFEADSLAESVVSSPSITTSSGLVIGNIRHETADADVTRITINLAEYEPSGGAMQRNVGREVMVSGLQRLEALHSDNMALKGLARAERTFIELIGSDKLVAKP